MMVRESHKPTTSVRERVLAAMADGGLHSGEILAKRLGVSRAAVWKAIESLRGTGHSIEAEPGRGYRALTPYTPLDTAIIRDNLPSIDVRVVDEIDSTNSALRNSPPPKDTVGMLFAEHQTAGRGRLGRGWVSPRGGIYFSVSWPYRHLERGPVGLSLGVGVYLAQRLRALGVGGAGVKWPNDIWRGDAKLAGVLMELDGDPTGACRVVIGVGVNWRVSDHWADAVNQRVVGVADVAPALSRNRVAVALATAVVEACTLVPKGIVKLLTQQWPRVDVLAGRGVRIELPGRTVTGVAAGVDAEGALLLDTAHGRQRFLSGDVSVRPVW